MNNILIAIFAVTMKGTVDRVNNNQVVVEMVAKDGHTHEAEFPRWIFPCTVEEGTVFWIDIFKKNVTIRCD